MDLSASERLKYQAMWEQPAYRERSPGMRLAARAHAWMGCKPRESLCDWGAGTGRASAWFADQGLQVTAVDIAENAITEFDGDVSIANLWELPDTLGRFDYGYCCDVMEHIPPEHVEASMRGIAERTTKAAFFQIALFECHMGDDLGLHLHLTVRPANWWCSTLQRQFGTVDLDVSNKYVLARCVPR